MDAFFLDIPVIRVDIQLVHAQGLSGGIDGALSGFYLGLQRDERPVQGVFRQVGDRCGQMGRVQERPGQIAALEIDEIIDDGAAEYDQLRQDLLNTRDEEEPFDCFKGQ